MNLKTFLQKNNFIKRFPFNSKVVTILTLLVLAMLGVIYSILQPEKGIIIGPLETNHSVAMGIDDEGTVSGFYFSKEGVIHFFTWTLRGKINLYEKNKQANDELFKKQINKLGQKVENLEIEGKQCAFIIQKNGERFKLPLLGGDQSYVSAINNNEQAVGYITTHASWWKEKWNEIADKLGLPYDIMFSMSNHNTTQAVLWTVPPAEE